MSNEQDVQRNQLHAELDLLESVANALLTDEDMKTAVGMLIGQLKRPTAIGAQHVQPQAFTASDLKGLAQREAQWFC